MSEVDGRTDSHENKFETMLRLKDGDLSDTGFPWLTTKGCVLLNDIIRCSTKQVEREPTESGSTLTELTAYLSRETGEYNLFKKSLHFTGANGSGKQSGSMNGDGRECARLYSGRSRGPSSSPQAT